MTTPQEATKAKILIVEDEALIGLDLKIRLSTWGYTVLDKVFSAEKALELIEQNPPDLVLMDIVLQGKMDGIEAAEIIRTRWGIPVIFTTAYADRERLKRAKLAYPFGYLMKPYQDRDIEVTLEMALYVAEADGERRKAEKELSRLEEKYRDLYDNAPDMFVSVDAKTATVIECNQTLANFLGYTKEEIIGRTVFDLYTPESSNYVRKNLFPALKARGAVENEELQIIRRDGSVIDVSLKVNAVLDSQGNIHYSRSVLRDITTRKRAEEAQRKSEEQYRQLVEQAVDGIFQLDAQGNFLFVNDAFCKMLRVSRETLLGSSIFDTYREAEKEMGRDRFAKIPSDRSIFFERDMVRKDGSTFPIGVSTIKLKDNRFQAIVRDITERKRVEQELLTSEAQLSNALSMAHAGHWEYDVASDTFTFNDNFYRIFRTTVEEVGGYTMSSVDYARRFCHPDDMSMVGEEVRAAIETDDPYYSRQVEHRIMYANGEVGHIIVRFFIVKDSQGRTAKTYGVNQDITEHKRKEEKLHDSERRLALASNIAQVGYWERNVQTGELIWTDVVYKMFGYEPGERVPTLDLFLSHIHPEDLENVQTAIQRSIGGPVPYRVEFKFKTKDGQGKIGLASGGGDFDENGKVIRFSGAIQDITEIRGIEEDLRLSRERLQLATTAARIGVWDWDIVRNNLVWDDSMYQLYGIGKDKFGGAYEAWLNSVHPDDMARTNEAVQAAIRGEKEYVLEFRIVKPDGSIAFIQADSQTIRDVNGNPQRMIGTNIDTTERKRTEDALRESETRLAAAQRIAHIGSWVWDVTSNTALWSEESFWIFGIPTDHLEEHRRNFLDMVHPMDRTRVDQALSDSLNGGKDYNLEYRIVLPDRTEKIIHALAEVFRNDQGEPVLMQGTVHDITERKRVEEVIQKEKERFQLLVEGSPFGVALIDSSDCYQYINPKFKEIFGYTLEEIPTRDDWFTKAYPDPGYRQEVLDSWEEDRKMAKPGEFRQHVLKVRCKNNADKWIDIKPISFISGTHLIFYEDITERKRAEEELRASEKLLAEAQHIAHVGSWTVSLDWKHVQLSQETYRIFGVDPEGFVATPENFFSLIHKDDLDAMRKWLLDCMAGQNPPELEFRVIRPDGMVRYLNGSGYLDSSQAGSQPYLVGSVQDITERKKAEFALKESEEIMRQVVKYDPFAIAVHDRKMCYIAASDHWLSDYGIKEDDIIGKSHYEIFPELPQRWKDLHQRCLAGSIERNDDDYFERPDGSVTYNRWEMRPWYRLDGTIGGAISYTEVTTERKLLEMARKTIIERYDLAADAAGIGVWDWDIKNNKLIWDDRMYELYGIKKDDFSGAYEAWLNGIHPEDRSLSDEFSKKVRDGEITYDTDFRVIWPDGTIHHLKAQGEVIKDPQGKPVRMIGINYDITERKQAEQRILASLKEKEILLQEIHHRVRNNLATIISILSLQAPHIEDEKAKEIFRECQNRVRTMSKIHTKLYQSRDIAHIDFRSYLQELSDELLLSYQIDPEAIKIDTQIEKISLDINTALPLGLLLTELITNSIKYAFPAERKGKIQITLQRETTHLVLTVSDNGIGFPENLTIQNTKTLGLQLVNGLIRQLRGSIEMKRDGGTVWTITFPVEK